MNFSQMLFQNGFKTGNFCAAIIGGGGKTALLHRLGNEFSQEHNRVLLTSLTRSAFSRAHNVVFLEKMPDQDLSPHFRQHNPLFIMHSQLDAQKLAGISITALQDLKKQSDLCLFECDGARNLSLKVHKEHDPPVPVFATHTIIVVGADVVDTSIRQGLVHRPELFRSIWNISDDDILDVAFIADVVTTPKGYLAKIPHPTNLMYFANKADTHPQQAQQLAQAIHDRSGTPTFYGSLHANICKEIQ